MDLRCFEIAFPMKTKKLSESMGRELLEQI